MDLAVFCQFKNPLSESDVMTGDVWDCDSLCRDQTNFTLLLSADADNSMATSNGAKKNTKWRNRSLMYIVRDREDSCTYFVVTTALMSFAFSVVLVVVPVVFLWHRAMVDIKRTQASAYLISDFNIFLKEPIK